MTKVQPNRTRRVIRIVAVLGTLSLVALALGVLLAGGGRNTSALHMVTTSTGPRGGGRPTSSTTTPTTNAPTITAPSTPSPTSPSGASASGTAPTAPVASGQGSGSAPPSQMSPGGLFSVLQSYASCMQSHGDPSFPNPDASSNPPFPSNMSSTPGYQQANETCVHLLPSGNTITGTDGGPQASAG